MLQLLIKKLTSTLREAEQTTKLFQISLEKKGWEDTEDIETNSFNEGFEAGLRLALTHAKESL